MEMLNITLADIGQQQIQAVLDGKCKLSLSEASRKAIAECKSFLDKKIETSSTPIYGVNTGFGSLCNVSIPNEQLTELQHQLILSHAAGVGNIVDVSIARLILYLKIHALSKGFSGVSLQLVDTLIAMFNADIIPVIKDVGSLGASGDLAPLAHMSLPLIGEGHVHFKRKIVKSEEALATANINTIDLQAKEGLALLNGTQFSLSHAIVSLLESNRVLKAANHIAALSCEAFNVHTTPYDDRLQRIRNHMGQINTADSIRELLNGGDIDNVVKDSVQDPYSFRCIPQVHGATWQTLHHVTSIFFAEANAVTDNPTVFADTDAVLSGGNFHAQPLALPIEYMGMAMSELGNISERRIYNMITGTRNLPPYLTDEPGTQSGYMIAQYTAAALVNKTKHLANPVSTDSIVSSLGQEDHVSMAANAGVKTLELVRLVRKVLAIELLVSAQATHYRKGHTFSTANTALLEAFRKVVPVKAADRQLSLDIDKAEQFIQDYFG